MAPERKEAIAVIGSACRFPGGSSSPSKLWELLREPRDVLQKIPIDRFNTNGVYHPNGMHHGSTNVRESYLLSEDYRHFDAQFFKIKPVEAHSMDPQQRLLLETVYESLDSAGQSVDRLRGSDTAVYVGLMSEEYGDILSQDIDYLPTYFPTATARSIMSNRISYVFDWHGPCMTIDTACSSSLVAVHQAVQALRNGDSPMAVAAGSNLCIGSKPYISENKLNMLSPGSRSRMWDADADGYARGDGVAALILKPLSKALEDGDHIECLIREPGVNQDGRTQGITMPSEIAQEKLIRETYAKAGLDITKWSDRPQFFEAHGTGTPAGDPIEAEAIRNSFFRQAVQGIPEGLNDALYVGSIKTVIGHTEGTAGIAALMKASLAMQNGVIPPNLLFNKLSPKVAPFYGKLKIATAALPWPPVAAGSPKRASVNSFGFGGTNAHVIIESYEPDGHKIMHAENEQIVALPFTFSAASEKSLASYVHSFTEYLEANKSIDLANLAYTLNFKRMAFPFRRSFSATTADTLLDKLHAITSKPDAVATVTTKPTESKILGVFTGQGAQWPTMGRELVQKFDSARKIVDKLQNALDSLPVDDRPTWFLMQELLAEPHESQLGKAAISQPLCTVVQVILVDMLRLAGVEFGAVVGHSSGEIGAAYAAGLLSAEDCAKIAYYRGVHSATAGSDSGAKGAMMAVGTNLEDAEQLCELEDLVGRVSVAACNSSSSVTLSGDLDAIEEAEIALKDEGKFVRKLKVDTAYHSHHMLPCAEPYTRSLEACAIQIQPQSRNGCVWFSSVTGNAIDLNDPSLRSTYWCDNMTGRVNFAQAVTAALESHGTFGAAIEVGPHPALQGPALQTIQEITGDPVPYIGAMQRRKKDIEAFADTLGFALAYIPEDILTFQKFADAMTPRVLKTPLKGLPSYAWEHDRIYWMESRLARAFRTRERPVHELLGTLSHDGSLRELRWRNVISPKEVPWLRGHKLQGQIVFPGSGHVSMAIEAAMVFAGDRNVRLLEVRDLAMGKAMVFEDEQSTADVQFTLVIESSSEHGAEARFHLEGTTNQNSDDMVTFSTGILSVEFGDTDSAVLPLRSAPLVDTVPVDTESFYTSLLPIGYEYSESFKALTKMRRTTDAGTAFITQPAHDAHSSSLLVHPGVLDCAIQAIILALCWPGDNRLWSLHVPNKISCIRLNPALLAANSDPQILLPVDALLTSFDSSAISGDVDFYVSNGRQAVMQLESVSIVPFSSGTPDMDVKFFFDIRWAAAAPDGALITRGARATKDENELATLCERVAYYYLRTLMEEMNPEEWTSAAWYFQQLRKFSSHYIGEIEGGRQPHSELAWQNDTREQIYGEMAKWPDNIDLKLMRAVGENLAATIRGETTILEHMMHDNVLNDFYVTGLGLDKYTDFLSNAVLQLAHRYTNMDILEIGAGTGGVTKTIIKQLGKAFNSYTYTDISSGFFGKAREVFRDYSDYMNFKTLDVEKDPVAQGFQENSYDLVVCSLVLHATENLERTLINVRRLLKPGGYLAMLEITNTNAIRIGFSMGGLPGWWLGHTDNRELNPCVPAARWDAELRNSGFAGIDTITPEVDTHAWLFSVILAQATDQRVEFVKDPLSSPLSISALRSKRLTIVGGVTPETSKLVDSLRALLQLRYESVVRIDSVEHFDPGEVPESATVLSLTELDDPVFKGLTTPRLDGLRRLFEHSRNVLWITKGARSSNPYAAMIIGFSRTLTMEMPHVRLQLLHHEGGQQASADKIAESLLRLDVTDAWEREEGGAKFLWTTEPELTLEDDRVAVPRLYPSAELNSRYNSVRRAITKPVELSCTVVGLAHTEAGYTSFEVPRNNIAQDAPSSDSLSIRLTYSSALATRISDHICLFLAKGTVAHSGEWVLAVVPELASEVLVPRAWTVPSDPPTANEDKELAVLGLHLVAQYIVGRTPVHGTLLVHDPSPALAEIVAALAAEQRTSCVITTTSSQSQIPEAIYIHPRSTLRTIKSVVPARVDSYADLAWQSTETGRIIANIYPPSSLKWNAGDLCSKWAFHQDQQHGDLLLALHLWKAASFRRHAAFARLAGSIEATSLSIKDMVGHSSLDADYVSNVIDWTARTVPVNVGPVDTKISFKPDKTYLLFGLSGQLGRSLTLYMARHGARHIVLTSRKPAVEDKWLGKTRELGADVQVLANDITDRESVRSLIDHVRETMPPIAGVANGAMVLQDTAITDMTVEIMNRVLAPKVNGSRYLDAIFQHNHELDFFVLLSSIATICGQHGQSNYTAANMFLNGLAAQRRRKGLVGSVMAIGAIMGIGYFSREVDEVTRERVIQAGYRMMSERDFHILFAETVLAGRPEAGDMYELITGLREINKEEDRLAQNPMFHHVVVRQGGVDGRKDVSTVRVPLKTLILAATTEEEARDHIKESFLHKLQVILQLEHPPTMDAGAEELGIDSLVAVEIRSWFLKELSVDIPVLKILGGATVGTMVDLAMEKLPAELTPNLKRANAESTKARVGEFVQPPETGLGGTTPPIESSTSTASSSSGDLAAESAPETPSTGISSIIYSGAGRKELMSYGQSRFWFMSGMLEDRTAFNIVFVIQLKGTIDVEKLRSAVRQIAYRHSALRTRFVDDDNAEGLQEVLPDPIFQLESRAVSSKEEVDAEFARLKARAYDLASGDVMQISLLSQSHTTHWLAVGYHHINMDSMSLQIMLKDLDKAYRGQPLSRSVLQYPEFATRQRAAFQQGRMKRELEYWKKEFPELPPVLPLLPFSKVRTRQPRTSYAHNRVDAKIAPSVAAAIKAACAQYRITPFHFHLAVFHTLLTRFLQVDDICIGMTDANRTELDELESLGLYLNMLPLRFRSRKGQRFAEAIKEAQTKVRNALANSRLPFDVLMEQLKPERSMEYSPVFQTFIDYKPPMEEKPELFGCKLGSEEYDVGQTAYDMMLSIVDDAKDPAVVIFQVQRSLYSKEEADILMKSYMWLLEQFGKKPELELERASLHAPEDVKEALSVGRGPIVACQWPETISHRVQQMMDAYGSSPAVVDGLGTRLAYRDLDARVNCVAQHLINLGVEPPVRIAVLQEPGIDWVVSFLAILKTGAVYVPLDLRSPPPRLGAVLQDCSAAFLLAHSATFKFAVSLSGRDATVINVSSLHRPAQGNSAVAVHPKADWPGLLLYTSGTTGVPKGAILKHAGILNQLEYSTKLFGVGHGSRILQQTAATFDLSIWEVFLALATGGCLVIASSAQRSDPAALVQLIVSEAVTFTMATPSEYAWWFQSDTGRSLKSSSWAIAAAAGEVFPRKLAQAFKSLEKPGFRAFNAYGPCEATLSSNITPIDFSDHTGPVGIGRAIQNMATYIVDEDLNVLPVGLPGEIVLAGVGIAERYINEEETRARFLPDKWDSPEFVSKGWITMYRTGDRGRMHNDGTVVALGRISGDTQVKINGQRLELQDIEQNLIQEAGGDLADAVVSVRGEYGAEFLVAHVSFAKGHPSMEQKAYFRGLLSNLPVPQYMRPSLVVALDRLPVTKHFKLDRGAISRLPLPDALLEDEFDDGMSETARKLKMAWEKVLPAVASRHHILSETSDFFHVGGTSMRLVRLQREVRTVFGVQLSLPDLFQHSTLGEMVDMIEAREAKSVSRSRTIDWEQETAVQHAIPNPGTHLRPPSTPQIIALTGATGFLGRTILRHLVSDPSITRIHCLAIRGDPSRTLPPHFSSPKVTLHYGDLTSPNLGLSESTANTLMPTLSAIIHNAADVSFMKSYHSLRPINVSTTREVARLAIPNLTPIHYISTAGVAHLSQRSSFGEVSVAMYPPPTDGSDGYTASKWASEVHLERASAASGVPVWIHRPSSIMGDDPAPTDMMANMLKYSLQMRAVPLLQGSGEDKLGLQAGFLDLVDVENVAGGVVRALTSGGAGEDLVEYVHHVGEMVLPIESIRESADGSGGAGLGFEVLTLGQWTERARKEGLNELVAEFLGTVEGRLGDRGEELRALMMYPRLLKGR